MGVDFVHRINWLKKKGDSKPWNRFLKFILNLEATENTFTSNQINFDWQFFESIPFEDLIKQDHTDYICIKSQDSSIIAIGKVRFNRINLIGEKEDPSIGYLWIITNHFPGLEEIEKRPVQIRPPHYIYCTRKKLNLELKTLFDKLQNTEIEIVEYVEYKENKNRFEVWRMKGNNKSDKK